MVRMRFLLVALMLGIVPFSSALYLTATSSASGAAQSVSDEVAASVVGGCYKESGTRSCNGCINISDYTESSVGRQNNAIQSCGTCGNVEDSPKGSFCGG
jgi:hypothetical protein